MDREKLKAHSDRLRLLVDTDGVAVDEFRIKTSFLEGLLKYIDVLEGESRRADAEPTPPPMQVVGGWHSVSVIGEVGHSYGVARNEDGLLVIASKRPDKSTWANGVEPKGDCWLTILGGNTRYSVSYAPRPDRPAGS